MTQSCLDDGLLPEILDGHWGHVLALGGLEDVLHAASVMQEVTLPRPARTMSLV